MSADRLGQIIQHRPFLQTQGLHHGQDPLHKAAATRTMATVGILPPQHSRPQYTLPLFEVGEPLLQGSNGGIALPTALTPMRGLSPF